MERGNVCAMIANIKHWIHSQIESLLSQQMHRHCAQSLCSDGNCLVEAVHIFRRWGEVLRQTVQTDASMESLLVKSGVQNPAWQV